MREDPSTLASDVMSETNDDPPNFNLQELAPDQIHPSIISFALQLLINKSKTDDLQSAADFTVDDVCTSVGFPDNNSRPLTPMEGNTGSISFSNGQFYSDDPEPYPLDRPPRLNGLTLPSTSSDPFSTSSALPPSPDEDYSDNPSQPCPDMPLSGSHDMPPVGMGHSRLHESRLHAQDRPAWISDRVQQRIEHYHLDKLEDTISKLKEEVMKCMAASSNHFDLPHLHQTS